MTIHFQPMPYALEYHTQIVCVPPDANPPIVPHVTESPIIIRNLNPKRAYIIQMATRNTFEVSQWGQQTKEIRVHKPNEVLPDNISPAFIFLIASNTARGDVRYELSAERGER